MIYVTNSAEETEKVGYLLAEEIDTHSMSRIFIALRGEMGVGKTAFVRGFASFFGITKVKSPTYTVVNEYLGKRKIFHFDMYRIEDEDDLYSIGFEDYASSDGICIAEWSENISNFIPKDAIFVTISRSDNSESQRKIEILRENV